MAGYRCNYQVSRMWLIFEAELGTDLLSVKIVQAVPSCQNDGRGFFFLGFLPASIKSIRLVLDLSQSLKL